jgi:hypothetical protein
MFCARNPGGISASSWSRKAAEIDCPPNTPTRSFQAVRGSIPCALAWLIRVISHRGESEQAVNSWSPSHFSIRSLRPGPIGKFTAP